MKPNVRARDGLPAASAAGRAVPLTLSYYKQLYGWLAGERQMLRFALAGALNLGYRESAMSDVSFELWSDNAESKELLPILRDAGLSVAEPVALQTRSLSPAELTTVIVSISGAVATVAQACRVYFERTGKTFTASTLNVKIHARNFTADEIKSIIAEADFLLMSRPDPEKLED